MTHASTFSGIGGAEVAADMMGWENLFHCEINPFGRKILDYHYPNSKSYEDITKTDFSEWRGRVDVLTGGFPCQPFSYAGKRRGAEDDRYLWPYMLRCIEQVRPSWFVGENVAGITTMVLPGETAQVAIEADLFGEGYTYEKTSERFVLDEICGNLERIGYAVQPFIIPACAVGAPHRRDRIFILAHNERDAQDSLRLRCETRDEDLGYSRQSWNTIAASRDREIGLDASYTDNNGLQHSVERGCEGEETSTQRGRGEDGIPKRTESTSADGGGRLVTDSADNGVERWDKFGSRREEIEGWTESSMSASVEADGRKRTSSYSYSERTDTDSKRTLLQRWNGCSKEGRSEQGERVEPLGEDSRRGTWCKPYLLPEQRWINFPTVSPVCRGNDGIPFDVDCLAISASKWRTESLKAYGNAIVPQVMYEIFRAIEYADTCD